MARVFVSRRLPGSALDRLRAAGHEVDVWPERLPPDASTLRDRVANADGLLALLTDRIDAELLAAAPRLRAIANYAVGYDNIDLEATAGRGIAVGNTPDVLTDATADLTFALLLAAARQIPQAAAQAATGDWLTWETEHHLGSSVGGGTLTIIGAGRIGSAVAARAAGFGMAVRTVGRGGDLRGALPGADFISLHCPLTAQTRRLIDADALAQMEPEAILINTARGPIVDQPALVDAVRAGTIAGAALDVTDPEPPAPDDPVLHTPGVLVTPHIGSATRAAREQMAELAVENLLAALAGEPMPHPVAGP
jgi:glyoxylate reductase